MGVAIHQPGVKWGREEKDGWGKGVKTGVDKRVERGWRGGEFCF
jgi:hypothetical protein